MDSSTGSTVAWLELQPHKLTREDRQRFKVRHILFDYVTYNCVILFFSLKQIFWKNFNIRILFDFMTVGNQLQSIIKIKRQLFLLPNWWLLEHWNIIWKNSKLFDQNHSNHGQDKFFSVFNIYTHVILPFYIAIWR